ncbi:MAG TPA: RHS repeat domain-containing protein [Terracidiphilus sp.]|nr:RHS repeat domain-containing protein [Terracidiphilus sp.]
MSAFFALVFLLSTCSHAQITNLTDQTSTPIPDVGHDYIKMLNETVNPANGSVSLDLKFPTPPQGVGPAIPVGVFYSSNQTYTMAPISARPGWEQMQGSQTYGSGIAGWSIQGPYLSSTTSVDSQNPSPFQMHYCYYQTNFVFVDRSNNAHPLGLAWQPDTQNCGGVNPPPSSVTTGGDGIVTATMNSSNTVITEEDGTQYTFNTPFAASTAGNTTISVPTLVTDAHGNPAIETFSTNALTSGGGVAVTLPSEVTVNGLGTPYSLGWSNGSGQSTGSWKTSFVQVVSDGDATCYGIPTINAASGGLGGVTLPNLQSYTFEYDPDYGTLSSITYPTGATITYTWEIPSSLDSATNWTDSEGGSSLGCVFKYGTPHVETRTVKYDGVNAAQIQVFSYLTSWDTTTPYQWDSKTTTVVTYDCTRGSSPASCLTTAPHFKTIYTYLPCSCGQYGNNDPDHSSISYYATINQGVVTAYSVGSSFLPPQIPLESQIQYYDWNGDLLRTVNKQMSLYALISEQTVIHSSGQVSYTTYPSSCGLTIPGEELDYDFGPGAYGTLLREKLLTSATGYTGRLLNACIPSMSQTFGSTGLAAQTSYVYDFPLNDVTSATACLLPSGSCSSGSPVTTYSYDSTGRVISETDPCGNGSCSDVIAGSGAIAAPTPSSQCSNGASGTPGLHTTTFSYQCLNSGGVSGAAEISYMYGIQPPPTGAGVNHGTVFGYNAAIGQLTSATDANGNTTSYQYSDPLARLTAAIGPQDPNNGNQSAKTTYSYSDTAPSPNTTTSLLLDTAGQKKTEVATENGLGSVLSVSTSDPSGPDNVVTTYDGMGNVLTASNPYRSVSDTTYGVISYTYDALGRKIFELAQDGTSRKQWCYDGQPSMGQTNCHPHLGSVTTGTWVDYTDENGNSWQMTYNALGQLTEVMEPNGVNQTPSMETDYTHDALNNLTGVTQWGGAHASAGAVSRGFSYDSLSRLFLATNPESGATTYTYDANGNVATKKTAAVNATSGTQTIGYCYDALNRITYKFYSASYSCSSPEGPAVSYSYDTSGVTGAQNDIGRLTEEKSWAGGTLVSDRQMYSYDAMGRLLNENQYSYAGLASGKPYPVAYQYDLAGHLIASTDGTKPPPSQYTPPSCNSGSAPTWTSLFFFNCYDGAGHLSSLTANWSDPTHPPNLFNSPSYAAFGGLSQASYANSLILTRSYDSRLRTIQEQDSSSGSSPAAGSATVTIVGSEAGH